MTIWQRRSHIILWEKPTKSQQVRYREDGTAPSGGHRGNRAPQEQVLMGPHPLPWTLRHRVRLTCQSQTVRKQTPAPASASRPLLCGTAPRPDPPASLVVWMFCPLPLAVAVQRLGVHRLSDWGGDHLSNFNLRVPGHSLALPRGRRGFADRHSASPELNGQIDSRRQSPGSFSAEHLPPGGEDSDLYLEVFTVFSAMGHQLSSRTRNTPRCPWLSSFISHEGQLGVVWTEATWIFLQKASSHFTANIFSSVLAGDG